MAGNLRLLTENKPILTLNSASVAIISGLNLYQGHFRDSVFVGRVVQSIALGFRRPWREAVDKDSPTALPHKSWQLEAATP